MSPLPEPAAGHVGTASLGRPGEAPLGKLFALTSPSPFPS